MPRLIEDVDIYNYLDIDPSEDDPGGNLLKIRDAVEEAIVHDCNREFGPTGLLVDEPYDGTGTKMIFTRRGIQSLESIKFRYLPEIVQEQFFTLDISQYITWSPGKRRIHSMVYPFPHGYDNVLISYHYSGDQPTMAMQAVREGTAMLYRTRGSEDARSEQMGTFQHVLKRKLEESLFWQRAVDALSNPVLG
jgi:hypothetical protein